MDRFHRQNAEWLQPKGSFVVAVVQDTRVRHTRRILRHKDGNICVSGFQHSKHTLAKQNENTDALAWLIEHRLEAQIYLQSYFQNIPAPQNHLKWLRSLDKIVLASEHIIYGDINLYGDTQLAIPQTQTIAILGGFDFKYMNPHSVVLMSRRQDGEQEKKTEEFYPIAEFPLPLATVAVAHIHVTDYIKTMYGEIECVKQMFASKYDHLLVSFGGVFVDFWNDFEDYADNQDKKRVFENKNIFVFFCKYDQRLGHYVAEVRMSSLRTNIGGALQPNVDICVGKNAQLIQGYSRQVMRTIAVSEQWCLVLENLILCFYEAPMKSLRIKKMFDGVSESIPLERILCTLHPIGVCTNIEFGFKCRAGIYPYFQRPWESSQHCGQCGNLLKRYRNYYPPHPKTSRVFP